MDEIERRRQLIAQLGRWDTRAELERSAFFRRASGDLDSILRTAEIRECSGAAPRNRDFVRVAQWNIEKGRQLHAVIEQFETNPVLRDADLVLLNEVDVGMARSGNRHVGWEIACRLGMHMVFGAAHLELTKGTGEDLDVPGENTLSVQGNAVLSRYPVVEARVVPLPVCFEAFEFAEKRLGQRNCVWARLAVGGRTLWAASVHLEVRETPACRARQVRHILHSPPGCARDALLIGGDFNTTGFARGTRMRTIQSIAKLVMTPAGKMMDRLVHPERGAEPLFRDLRRSGIRWEGFNAAVPTACTAIDTLEDGDLVPAAVSAFVRRRLAAYGGHLRFKLDWLLGRNIRPLREGEARDSVTGAPSVQPGAVPLPWSGRDRVSDHLPTYADFRIEV